MQCTCVVCHRWPVRLSNISPRYLKNETISEKKKKKKLLNINSVFWFSLQILSTTVLILRWTERDMIINVYWSSCKVPFILVRFFSTDFRKILKCQISWKSIQWEPSFSMRTNGRTDMTKIIVAFHNFANAPKSCYIILELVIILRMSLH